MGTLDRTRLTDKIRTYSVGYKIIDPQRYEEMGIEPSDVLTGTVASEDHPVYLLSRYGGNAFGMGLFEHLGRLDKPAQALLTELDLDDRTGLAANADRINELYKRLGLFVRCSNQGRPYYLIPLVWLSHSTAEFQDRAEEIVRQVHLYQQIKHQERPSILLLSPGESLLTAELNWRLGAFPTASAGQVAELKDLQGGYDLVILTQDPCLFVLNKLPPQVNRARPRKADLFRLCRYLSTKIYDLLSEEGRLIILAPRASQLNGQDRPVRFLDQAKLKNFLLFSHLFKTRRRYRSPGSRGRLMASEEDLFNFLTLEAVPRRPLKRLTKGKAAEDLSLADIDRMPRLNLNLKRFPFQDQVGLWTKLFEPFFEKKNFGPLGLKRTSAMLAEGLVLSHPLPETELLFVGDKRPPAFKLAEVEAAAAKLGLSGCPLPLLAEYKDSFDYLLRVSSVLARLKGDGFSHLPPLIRSRIRMPFDRQPNRKTFFNEVPALIRRAPKLSRLEQGFNPFRLEGARTPVLANLEKLSLMGFRMEQLREIYLILVGHSTMSRITFGKLRSRSLKAMTQVLRGKDQAEIVDTILAVRLMSLAEMAAIQQDGLPPAQAEELFSLTDAAIQVANDPDLDWQDLSESQIAATGQVTNLAIRRMLKLFGLFEHLDNWPELLTLGAHEKETLSDYESLPLTRVETVLSLVGQVNLFAEKFAGPPTPERSGFARRFLEREFHGTTRLLPALGPVNGVRLLWVAVTLSNTIKINFNPLHSDLPAEAWRTRVERLGQALAKLEMDALSPQRLSILAEQIEPDRPVFVYDSGLMFTFNSKLGTLDVSFIDLEEELKHLNQLITGTEGQAIADLDRNDLSELSNLYGHLKDYLVFMGQDLIRALNRERGERDLYPVRSRKIALVFHRLAQIFLGRLFQPEVLHLHLTRLHQTAPRLMSLLLPELTEMDRLPPAAPHYPGHNMLHFFLEAAYKFQALTTGRLEAFQDQQALHRLAVQEFGPSAGGGVGVSPAQMDILSRIIGRLKRKSYLLRAVAVALTFQDIDRLPRYRESYSQVVDRQGHGQAGAELLAKTGILDRYPLAPGAKRTAIRLVGHHGLLGRVVRSETRPEALEEVTEAGDEDLFDAFFIHNLVAIAAIRQEAVTEDLMDRLLELRNQALSVIRGQTDWRSLVAEQREAEQSRLSALINKPRPLASEEVLPGRASCHLGGDLAGAAARTVAGLQRLYRLHGMWFLTVEAVLLFSRKVSLVQIQRRLGLASIGQANLERSLYEVLRLEREGLAPLGPKACGYLLDRLADLDRPVSLPGFPLVAERISPVNRFKLAVIGLLALDRLGGGGKGPVTVDFNRLAQVLGDRYELINESAAQLDLDRIMAQPKGLEPLSRPESGISLMTHSDQRTVSFVYLDRFRTEDFTAQAAAINNLQDLAQAFHDLLLTLRRSPSLFQAYGLALEKIYEARKDEITSEMMTEVRSRLMSVPDLEDLFRIHQDLQEDPFFFSLNENQRQLIDHVFEVRREILRRRLSLEWSDRLERVKTRRELEDLWQSSKVELKKRRKLIGRQLERRISRWFDVKATQLGPETE